MTRRLALLLALAASAAGARAQILVYGALARDRAAVPGQAYEEEVQVHNPTAEPQQARLYLTDYAFAADGSNAYAQPGTSERSNAGWISFAPPVLTIPPGETIPVTIRVEAPAGPLAGSYWSMLMIEAIPPGSAESTLGDGELASIQFGVRERIRYGIQIASHVAPEAGAQAEIAAVALVQGEDGSRVLAADVANTGDRMFDGPVYVDVFTADGAALGRIAGSRARIYPGTSFRHRVDLSALAPGVYEALFVIDGGAAGVFGAQYSLEL